jgi:hypothetical protein
MDTALEAAILGAVLLDNSVLDQTNSLSPSDFSLGANGTILERMRDLQLTGAPIDVITLAGELEAHKELESIGGRVYLSSLLDGAVQRHDISFHVGMVRQYAGARVVAHQADAISKRAQQPGRADLSALIADVEQLKRAVAKYQSGPTAISRYGDIPDIMEIDVPPLDWVVDGLFPRKSLTLWAGADGTAKTYLAMKMAIAVSLGSSFLNRICRRTPVLYLDYENPDHEVKSRTLRMAHGSVPALKIWGTWLRQQPPPIGDPLLLKIAEEEQPLIIVDPFRYAHSADENDSTEMIPIMRHLRSYAAAGAVVIVLHHPAKAEGSSGRGSTAIRGAVDIAYLQEMDDSGLITLKCVKNRFGEKRAFSIYPDFNEGRFDVVDFPIAPERDYETAIAKAIQAKPGMTQKQIITELSIGRTKASEILRLRDGILWRSEDGPHRSLCYFPISCTAVPGTGRYSGTTRVQRTKRCLLRSY